MTDPTEFKRFYDLLMTCAPTNYFPWIFVVDKLDKAPHLARGAWSLPKNRITLEQSINLLYRGFNLGIAGMEDHLIIVDIDNEDAIDADTLIPTLSIRSRSRTGTHHFYYIDDIKDKINIALPDVGELRGQHQYVVCAGSYATTDPDTVPEDQRELAGKYTIENAIPPAHITFNDLPIIFRKQYNVNYLIPLIKEKMAAMSRIFDPPIDNTDRKSKSVLFDLEVTDIVHVSTNGHNFASPLHGSKTGKNSTYSDGWLKCFRCGCSHNAMTLLAVMAGIDTCSNAGFGHKHSCAGGSSIDMTNGATVYRVWDFARRNGYVPRDDPPPNTALRWFVVESGICGEDEIDDWRVPDWAYIEGRRLLRSNI